MKILKYIASLLLVGFTAIGMAQSPQTHNAPIFSVNAKYVNGVAPGYWITAASGLNVNVGSGTSFCTGTVVQYAGGSLSLTASTTNNIYLNTSSSCAPTVKTSAFGASDIPLAVVVTSGGGITSITDLRTPFVSPSSGGSGTPGGSPGQLQYNNSGAFGGFTVSGDGTLVPSTGILVVTKTGGVPFATSAIVDTTNASNISTGTLGSARLPLGSASTFGAIQCGTGTSCTSGVLSVTAGTGTVTTFSATATVAPLFTTSISNATTTPALTITITNAAQNSVLAGPVSGGAGVPSYQTAPTFSAANLTSFPTFNQNTTGTAANLSGTPALPNGTTATTQSLADSTTKIATDAFVIANAGHSSAGSPGAIQAAAASGAFADSGCTNPSSGTLSCIIVESVGVAGTAGGYDYTEGTTQTALTGHDIVQALASTHRFQLSLNGGSFLNVPQVIASGSSALSTSSVTNGACVTTTVSATGVATTDVISYNPNGSIKAVTGYVPGTSGGLTIASYPTSGNVNFDVCNWSGAPITPGAVTVNWQVIR